MLKIKDNVDLKELKKFGFKYHKEQRNQYEHYSVVVKKGWSYSMQLLIVVYCNDRNISVCDNEGQDILFDLIQADLVEKVEE